MERFKEFKVERRLNESKESTLRKCMNLTQEQKAEALQFFNGKGQALWSSIDWNRPQDVTWDKIEDLMDKASQSNQQMKKRMKNLNVGLDDLAEGKDYWVVHKGEDYILYQPLSHKGACVLASNDVYPQVRNVVPHWARHEGNEWWERKDALYYSDGAHWCIALFRTSEHWDSYTGKGSHTFFVMCYTGTEEIEDRFRKVCIDYTHDSDDCNYWDGNDDTFNNGCDRIIDILDECVGHLNDPVPIEEGVMDEWNGLFERFHGVRFPQGETGFFKFGDCSVQAGLWSENWDFDSLGDYIRKANTYTPDARIRIDISPNGNVTLLWRHLRKRFQEGMRNNGKWEFGRWGDNSLYLMFPVNARVDSRETIRDINAILDFLEEKPDINFDAKDTMGRVLDLLGMDESNNEGQKDFVYKRGDSLLCIFSSLSYSSPMSKEEVLYRMSLEGKLCVAIFIPRDEELIGKLPEDVEWYITDDYLQGYYDFKLSVEKDILEPIAHDLGALKDYS